MKSIINTTNIGLISMCVFISTSTFAKPSLALAEPPLKIKTKIDRQYSITGTFRADDDSCRNVGQFHANIIKNLRVYEGGSYKPLRPGERLLALGSNRVIDHSVFYASEDFFDLGEKFVSTWRQLENSFFPPPSEFNVKLVDTNYPFDENEVRVKTTHSISFWSSQGYLALGSSIEISFEEQQTTFDVGLIRLTNCIRLDG